MPSSRLKTWHLSRAKRPRRSSLISTSTVTETMWPLKASKEMKHFGSSYVFDPLHLEFVNVSVQQSHLIWHRRGLTHPRWHSYAKWINDSWINKVWACICGKKLLWTQWWVIACYKSVRIMLLLEQFIQKCLKVEICAWKSCVWLSLCRFGKEREPPLNVPKYWK